MTDPLTLTISALALVVSVATAWLSLFRRGTVKMTHPSVIYFGPDTPKNGEHPPYPKVFLRFLLFSTGKRGRIVESMYASLKRNETMQNFNVWVYGDKELVRGSGLFIGEDGKVFNHHFLTPRDGNNFRFTEGVYSLKIYAKLFGDAHSLFLFSTSLIVTAEHASALQTNTTGLYFDWSADSKNYLPHMDQKT